MKPPPEPLLGGVEAEEALVVEGELAARVPLALVVRLEDHVLLDRVVIEHDAGGPGGDGGVAVRGFRGYGLDLQVEVEVHAVGQHQRDRVEARRVGDEPARRAEERHARRQAGDLQRVGFRAVDVDERGGDVDDDLLHRRAGAERQRELRRVGDGLDGHRDGGDVAAAVAVVDRVGEGLGARPVRVRLIDDPVAHDRGRAVQRILDPGDRQRLAVAVGVVGDRVDGDGGVLERGGGVVVRVRGRRRGDADLRRAVRGPCRCRCW